TLSALSFQPPPGSARTGLVGQPGERFSRRGVVGVDRERMPQCIRRELPGTLTFMKQAPQCPGRRVRRFARERLLEGGPRARPLAPEVQRTRQGDHGLGLATIEPEQLLEHRHRLDEPLALAQRLAKEEKRFLIASELSLEAPLLNHKTDRTQ